ncbi:hypothetical protein [Bradyrhizobium roseum]|uniref:hypothetical protein n=1 Tax=Bradyrhizobium roseum TaxID=3056648 RepID=UPI00260AF912|nr:hypothetical protein [Bradyrhizobium roseus]WKA27989.1 hypothetical protein QUH67_31290 [Bradyrhizobium roseus]
MLAAAWTFSRRSHFKPDARQVGIIGMAIVGATHRSRDCCEEAGKRSPTAGPRSPVPRFLTVCVILCALSFAGCARHPAQRELGPAVHENKAPPARATPRPRRLPEIVRYVQPTIRRPDPALLAPQPAPDCEFKRSDLKTVDPDEWKRLKVEYERQCFQDAEKAARERLMLLQTSSLCEIEPAQRSKSAPSHSK